MQRLGMHQRIGHTVAKLCNRCAPHARQLGVQKLQIERRIVNNQLGTGDKFQKLISHLLEGGLVGQKVRGQTVHPQRFGIAVTIGTQIGVIVATGDVAIDDFNRTDLNDSVSVGRIQSGCFSV